MHNTPGPDATGIAAPTQQTNKPAENDFDPQEIARLIEERDRVARGELNEWTSEYKRLLFARWLYEHGQLQS
jgi:hypothetical protein